MQKFMLTRFATLAVGATTVVMLAGGLPLIAQEPVAAKTRARKAFDPTRRVPMYFGQLGLTDEQKESIYAIQAKEMPKVEALEKQIDELRGQMLRDCEAILTPAQKQLLDQRRVGGAEARVRKGVPVAKP